MQWLIICLVFVCSLIVKPPQHDTSVQFGAAIALSRSMTITIESGGWFQQRSQTAAPGMITDHYNLGSTSIDLTHVARQGGGLEE